VTEVCRMWAKRRARAGEAGLAAYAREAMPRPLRVQPPGAIFHLTARGNRRQPIYLDALDYGRFLALLGEVVERFGWRLHAYCLMPNHFHLLVELQGENLSAGMQYLNGQYAQYFNRRHCLDGHLFQGRFHSVFVESEAHLLELYRYIVLNPVRAGLCWHPAQWPWSSYGAALGRTTRPAFLRLELLQGLFGAVGGRAAQAYAAFVAAAPRRPRIRDGPNR
jgi:putative transposase